MGAEKGGKSRELNEEQVRTLAKLIYRQEVNRIKTVPFKSEYDRVHHLRQSREAYNHIITQLDEAAKLVEATQKGQPGGLVLELDPPQPPVNDNDNNNNNNDTATKLALQYLDWATKVSGFALVVLNSINMRLSYMVKVREHAQDLLARMDSLKSLEFAEDRYKAAFKLIEEIEKFRNVTAIDHILEQGRPSSFILARSLSLSPKSAQQMIRRSLKKLAWEEPERFGKKVFDELSIDEKMVVMDDVLETYGSKLGLLSKISTGIEVAGNALLVVTVILAVIDVVASKNKAYTAAKTAVLFATSYAVAEVATDVMFVVGGALIAAFEASAVAGFILNIVAPGFGFAAALGATVFIGWLMDRIFHSGEGKHPKPKPRQPVTELHYHVPPMPDGGALARRLLYTAPAA